MVNKKRQVTGNFYQKISNLAAHYLRVRPELSLTRDAEQDLIEKARHGDEAAFEQWISMYEESIFRYMCASARNNQDAEDWTQELWEKLWIILPRNKIDWPRTWLFRVASNHMIDCLRKRSRHLHATLEEVEASEKESPDPRPEQIAESHDNIRHLLDGLNYQEKEVIIHLLNGLSVKEIAAITGMDKSKVYRLRHDALVKIQQTMSDH